MLAPGWRTDARQPGATGIAMKILLLGGTGRTGNEVLAQALQVSIAVQAVVRRAASVRVASPQLTLFESQVLDRPTLRAAMRGCDAVISTLNISRRSEFPWSGLRTPPHLLSDTMRNVLAVAQELSIRRIISVSAWGAGETRSELPGWFRWLVEHSNLAPAYRDHERQEQLLAASACDWTVVRPVILTNGRRQAQLRVGSRSSALRPTLLVSRASVAGFLLELCRAHSHVREAVTISAG